MPKNAHTHERYCISSASRLKKKKKKKIALPTLLIFGPKGQTGLMQIQCFYLEGTGYLHTISDISHHKTLYLLVINNVDTSFFLTLKHV